ncbi:MAG: diguanylate cyclase [Nitrospirae bacterium]|nr:diguanylate cyclase [Nitrospirota bacterium]
MGKSVLIVDDSPMLRQKVTESLREAQLFENYFEANDGFNAIKVLSKEEVDMIICDVMMPRMDGFKLMEMISKEKRLEEIMVVMLSANRGLFDKIKGLESGAIDYITKPFHPQELVVRVRILLKMKQLQNELKTKIVELKRVTILDDLTGLYNQRYLYDTLKREYNRSDRFNLKLSLVMLDIDNFKDVNDTYGHQRGDTIIKEVARLLQVVLRGYDFAVRYGGDEFIIVLSQNTVIGSHIVAERIRKTVEGSPLLSELNGGKHITVSIGVATFPDDTKGGYEALISKADQALYSAKRNGRNRVAYNMEDENSKF